MIDISPLERVITRLEEALDIFQLDAAQSLIRDGLIHRFECTYELSHGLLKRYLAENVGSFEDFDGMNFADLIRIGNESGLLLGNWPCWKAYRDIRRKTNLTDDETATLEVVASIPAFLDEVRYLRDRLRERNIR